MKYLITLITLLLSFTLSSQSSCATAIQVPQTTSIWDFDCTGYNPPVDQIKVCYTFNTYDLNYLHFQFTSFVPSGSDCFGANIIINYELYDENCNLLFENQDGIFDVLDFNTQYTICYSAQCLSGLIGNVCSSELTTLPIQLLSFEYKIQFNKVTLEWYCVENNTDYYEIYNSTDLINWELVGSVQGGLHWWDGNPYYIIHDSPIDGSNYYRLDHIDFDGLRTKFNVISVEFKSKNIENRLGKYNVIGQEVK